MVNELGACSKIAQKKMVIKAKKITASIRSRVIRSYFGIRIANNTTNSPKAVRIAKLEPSHDHDDDDHDQDDDDYVVTT